MRFGPLWLALFVANPIYLIYWLATESQSNGSTEDSALAARQDRYISGEIDDVEHVTDRVMSLQAQVSEFQPLQARLYHRSTVEFGRTFVGFRTRVR